MAETVNRSLLPESLVERLERREVTNGQYHEMLPSFPTPALVNHGEVYLAHCSAMANPDDLADASARFHSFVVPELFARMGGSPVRKHTPPAGDSPFRRLLGEGKWQSLCARMVAAADYRAYLASLTNDALAAHAEAVRRAITCRWKASDLVYDATLYHVIVPELLRRLCPGRPAVS